MQRIPIRPDEPYLQLLTMRELNHVPSITKAEAARVLRTSGSNLMRDAKKLNLKWYSDRITLESIQEATKKRIELIRTLEKLYHIR